MFNDNLSKEELQKVNEFGLFVKDKIEDLMKSVETLCTFSGVFKEEGEYEFLIACLIGGILYTVSNEECYFGKIKSTYRNGVFSIENFYDGKLYKFQYLSGHGVLATDKQGKPLHFDNDLNPIENRIANFLSFITVGLFEDIPREDVNKTIINFFEENAKKRQSTEIKKEDLNISGDALLEKLARKKQSQEEDSKDINEHPLNIHKEFCDLLDGKKVGDKKTIIEEYIRHLVVLYKAVNEKESNIAHGWSNIFAIKNDDKCIFVGDFNSRFNTIVFRSNLNPKAGIFKNNSIIDLAPNSEYNSLKAGFFIELIKLIRNYVENGNKIKISEVVKALEELMEDEDYSPDTVSIKPIYNNKISFISIKRSEKSQENKEEENEESVKDVNEYPLYVQRELCDLLDKKSKRNSLEILEDYMGYLIVLFEVLEENEPNKAYGWSNLFGVKNDDSYFIVGDFNSNFNAIVFSRHSKSKIGLFAFDGIMEIAPNIEYNRMKSLLFIMMLQLAYDSVKEGKKAEIQALDLTFQMLLSNEKHIADTKSVEPIYKNKINFIEIEKNKQKESHKVDLNISGNVLLEKLKRQNKPVRNKDIFEKIQDFANKINNTVYSEDYDELATNDELVSLTKELIENANPENEDKTIESILMLSKLKDPCYKEEMLLIIEAYEFLDIAFNYLHPIRIIDYLKRKEIIKSEDQIVIGEDTAKEIVQMFDYVEQLKHNLFGAFLEGKLGQ